MWEGALGPRGAGKISRTRKMHPTFTMGVVEVVVNNETMKRDMNWPIPNTDSAHCSGDKKTPGHQAQQKPVGHMKASLTIPETTRSPQGPRSRPL